jgi:hypothetical protein
LELKFYFNANFSGGFVTLVGAGTMAGGRIHTPYIHHLEFVLFIFRDIVSGISCILSIGALVRSHSVSPGSANSMAREAIPVSERWEKKKHMFVSPVLFRIN